MEPFYYNQYEQEPASRLPRHAAGTYQSLRRISDSAPGGKGFKQCIFELRLDHPEIFWASGFKYKYYPDSPNLILIPEYLFDKGKIREHQKAMNARVEKLARPGQ